MGIVLVYDITTEDSFKNIAQWLQNIDEASIIIIITSAIMKWFFKY